ncbi:AP-2 complex subunit beta-like isoform X2 [Phocoena sinus]|uniref:AP-2 complex subunit beta-like isoform X2 n=1 Tax=Phocoena sinus TaxID=42100 RepID=UPI0013C465E1|nr:AP-2 complex subunit beta-like isoform X2 [Phocoena sinus]
MTDSKYFTTNKKGEIFELKAELNNEKKKKRKEAVKKVIAAMTVGKDVSCLFPDVVNCMQTDNLELKKLMYLYLMSYAKSQPDMAIMAVNSFVKDCEDPNPLIRALAVRTMGSIQVDKITEYLCEPHRKCLKDEDPYVQKTKSVCVAKLNDINAQMVEDQGFLDSLRDLIADSNPMVGQSFIPSSVPATFAPSPTPVVVSSGLNDLFELSTGIGMAPGGYVAPKAVWLPAVKAKGLEIPGTFTHRQGHIYMEMNFTNKALQHVTDFAIQFNKNSFGVIPSTPLAIHTPLMPNQSIDVSLPLNTLGPVMKMEPLNNLQVQPSRSSGRVTTRPGILSLPRWKVSPCQRRPL